MNKMNRFLVHPFAIICVLAGWANLLYGQQSLDTPELTISTFFEGMYEGDSAKIRQTLHKDASFHTVTLDRNGKEATQKGDVTKFLEAVGTPHEDVWDERIQDLTIQIDGNLAQAWMKYTFYIGENRSHCGVNAMHLIRSKGEWEIFQVVDTRRRKECD